MAGQANFLSDRFSDLGGQVVMSTEAALKQLVDNWLRQHPVIHWLFHHPIAALILVAVVILLLAGLFGAIARSSEQFWILLAKLPFVLLGWLVRVIARVFGTQIPAWQRNRARQQSDRQTQLRELLAQLEESRRHQEELLNQVKQLLQEEKLV